MELRFKAAFNHDIDISNRKLLDEIKNSIINVKSATSISKIRNLKKVKEIRNPVPNKCCKRIKNIESEWLCAEKLFGLFALAIEVLSTKLFHKHLSMFFEKRFQKIISSFSTLFQK